MQPVAGPALRGLKVLVIYTDRKGRLPAGKIMVQRQTFTKLPAESNKIDEVRARAAVNKFFTIRCRQSSELA